MLRIRICCCLSLGLLACALSACKTHNPFTLPWFSVAITSFSGPAENGETTMQCAVVGGFAPYTYSWNLGGGAEPNVVASPAGAASSLTVVLRPGTWTITVTATDAQGVSASDTTLLTVPGPAAPEAAVSSAVYNHESREILVKLLVRHADGDVLTVMPTVSDGYHVVPARLETAAPQWTEARFTIRLANVLASTAPPLQISFIITDGAGNALELPDDVSLPGNPQIEPIVFAPSDALVAVATQSQARVGEPVQIVVLSALPAHPFNRCEVLLTLPDDARPRPGSFNLGTPDGPAYGLDGKWVALPAGTQFAAVNDYFGISQADYEAYRFDSSRLAFPFRLEPQWSGELQGSGGAIFSFEVIFTAPGHKTIGFGASSPQGGTRYFDADGQPYAWGDSSNSIGFPNSIIVTE